MFNHRQSCSTLPVAAKQPLCPSAPVACPARPLGLPEPATLQCNRTPPVDLEAFARLTSGENMPLACLPPYELLISTGVQLDKLTCADLVSVPHSK